MSGILDANVSADAVALDRICWQECPGNAVLQTGCKTGGRTVIQALAIL